MDFNNIRVMNFENALRGMRNPKESYALSDSYFGLEANNTEAILERTNGQDFVKTYVDGDLCEFASIGPNDMKLAKTLIKAGSEHRKFMRQIFVSADITAPLYWWKEADTYKVATTANSTSTMHTIQKTPITFGNFEMGDFKDTIYDENGTPILEMGSVWRDLIKIMERVREIYNATGNKEVWKELIRILPESWLQTRTWTASYETLLGVCSPGQRRFHKLDEWKVDFINCARELPYAQDLLFGDELS